MNKLTAASLLSNTFLRRAFESVATGVPTFTGGHAGPVMTEIRIALRQLRAAGLIEENAGHFTLTAKGRSDHGVLCAFEQKLEAF